MLNGIAYRVSLNESTSVELPSEPGCLEVEGGCDGGPEGGRPPPPLERGSKPLLSNDIARRVSGTRARSVSQAPKDSKQKSRAPPGYRGPFVGG